MRTRRALVDELRLRPGSTVAELATRLGLTGMGVRRHLVELMNAGLVERVAPAAGRNGRPAAGWRLTDAGLELFPRHYDEFALGLLDDACEEDGPDAVAGMIARRVRRWQDRYEAGLDGEPSVVRRLEQLVALRDADGYLASVGRDDDGNLLLVQRNCPVHRVARRYQGLCAAEAAMLSHALGDDVRLEGVANMVRGDPSCTYRLCMDEAAATPAAPE